LNSTLLLRLLAWVFAIQFAIYGAGAAACIYAGLVYRKAACADFDANLQRTFETATGTVLALLGGKAMSDR
jgi:hypothetical protein